MVGYSTTPNPTEIVVRGPKNILGNSPSFQSGFEGIPLDDETPPVSGPPVSGVDPSCVCWYSAQIHWIINREAVASPPAGGDPYLIYMHSITFRINVECKKYKDQEELFTICQVTNPDDLDGPEDSDGWDIGQTGTRYAKRVYQIYVEGCCKDCPSSCGNATQEFGTRYLSHHTTGGIPEGGICDWKGWRDPSTACDMRYGEMTYRRLRRHLRAMTGFDLLDPCGYVNKKCPEFDEGTLIVK